MGDKIYSVDFNKLVVWLLPRPLRRVRMVAFLKAMVLPFISVYMNLMVFRKAKLYQLSITPQVCWLTRLLNDRYDRTWRRIKIEDGVDKPPFYIYLNPELKPKYLRRSSEAMPPKYIYTGGESGLIADDFIVKIPIVRSININELIALVKAYKLAGTKFKVQQVGR